MKYEMKTLQQSFLFLDARSAGTTSFPLFVIHDFRASDEPRSFLTVCEVFGRTIADCFLPNLPLLLIQPYLRSSQTGSRGDISENWGPV